MNIFEIFCEVVQKNGWKLAKKWLQTPVAKRKICDKLIISKSVGDGMNLSEAIYVRKSVRNFIMEPISASILEDIGNFYQEVPRLFPGIDTELGIIDNSRGELRLKGLFGVKAPYYLALYSQITDKYQMNAGFILEQLCLYLTAKGFGSCIMSGAVVKGSQTMRDAKKLVMMVAFGKSRGAHTRQQNEAKRLSLGELCVYKEPPKEWALKILEAARLAPSSYNSQPWRFVVYAKRIHIFSKKVNVERLKKWDELNFGIMFAHMMIVAEELWLDLDLIRLEDISQKTFSKNQYVLSAVLKS